jgi:hypothetical protein
VVAYGHGALRDIYTQSYRTAMPNHGALNALVHVLQSIPNYDYPTGMRFEKTPSIPSHQRPTSHAVFAPQIEERVLLH